jgi:hypothetical protein
MPRHLRQAAACTLLGRACEIRLRAERKAGQILGAMAKAGERDSGKGNRNPALKSHDVTPKLSDLEITKKQSSDWQQPRGLL